MKHWFSDMQKEVHVLGPLLPPGYDIESRNSEERTNVDFETFLGEMLVQHGSIFCKILSFLLRSNYIIFLRFPLALPTGR